jgi:hypothetical protein
MHQRTLGRVVLPVNRLKQAAQAPQPLSAQLAVSTPAELPAVRPERLEP